MADDFSEWKTDEFAFIQWKGTDVCMDLHCPSCHYHNHYDGFFAYFVQCAKCKATFEMRGFVQFRPGTPNGISVLTCEYEEEDDDSPSAQQQKPNAESPEWFCLCVAPLENKDAACPKGCHGPNNGI